MIVLMSEITNGTTIYMPVHGWSKSAKVPCSHNQWCVCTCICSERVHNPEPRPLSASFWGCVVPLSCFDQPFTVCSGGMWTPGTRQAPRGIQIFRQQYPKCVHSITGQLLTSPSADSQLNATVLPSKRAPSGLWQINSFNGCTTMGMRWLHYANPITVSFWHREGVLYTLSKDQKLYHVNKAIVYQQVMLCLTGVGEVKTKPNIVTDRNGKQILPRHCVVSCDKW